MDYFTIEFKSYLLSQFEAKFEKAVKQLKKVNFDLTIISKEKRIEEGVKKRIKEMTKIKNENSNPFQNPNN